MLFKKFNKKIVLGMAAMVAGVGVVALCSFFPFIIDPKRWQTSEFLSDELIMVAIVIFSTMCLMFISQASNNENVDSEISKARAKFTKSVKRITEGGLIVQFSQWVKNVFQKNDVKSMKERMSLAVGVEDFSVLELEDEKIRSLVGKMQSYGGHTYPDITKKQADEIINRVKRAKIKLVSPSYYLMCSTKSNDRTMSEMSGDEQKKKGVLLTFSLVSRIVMSLVIAMIFASLVYDTATGVEKASAWMKFASRMFTMATSSFMGFLLGSQMNDIDADYINMKCIVHDQFFEDAYSKKSKVEIMDERYQEQEIKANGKENVADPILG